MRVTGATPATPRAASKSLNLDAQPLAVERLGVLLMKEPSQPGLPTHLSAGSGLLKLGKELLVVGDDEVGLGVFRGAAKGTWVPLLQEGLPLDRELRHQHKPDFEALAALPAFPGAPHGAILAVPSGSTPQRARASVVPLGADGAPSGTPKTLDLRALYAALERRIPSLNIEGAVVMGNRLRLLQRADADTDSNAIIDLDLQAVLKAIEHRGALDGEVLREVTSVHLGSLGGVQLGFSDASALPDGRLVFTASAENSTDSYNDGEVVGSVVGVMEPDGRISAQFAIPGHKVEGVAAEVAQGDLALTMVTDADDPEVPALLLGAKLAGLGRPPALRSEPSRFEPAGPAAGAKTSAQGFLEVAKASGSGIGWVTGDAAAARGTRLGLAELRHFAKLADQGGLQPAELRVAPQQPGAPDSEWFSHQGQVVWQLRTPGGRIPPGLEALAKDRGVSKLTVGELAGAQPISPVADVSAPAAFQRAMALADRLFSSAGGDPQAPQFQLFRYTVARYLLNATTPQALAYLAQTYQGDTQGLLATGQVPARWVEKLERGFKKPYTNDEALGWLNQMAAKLEGAVAFIDANNPKGAPVTFYTAGSTTKARWSVGSDLDILIDTPDAELMKAVLTGPHGFYGGADKEEFAILNASFYWDRTAFFGTPVKLATGTQAMKPALVEETFLRTSREDWGVAITPSAEGAKVELLPAAREKFVKEAPVVTEVLYDMSRPTRAQVDTRWVTEHWEAIVREAPEVRLLSRERMIETGRALVTALLPEALSPARLSAYFESPAGQRALGSEEGKAWLSQHGLRGFDPARAELPWGALVPPMDFDLLLGVADPVERLFIDFASAEQSRLSAEQGAGAQGAWRAALEQARS